jgi:hypothetical protein
LRQRAQCPPRRECYNGRYVLSDIQLQGTIVSLDGGYDCRQNRKAIFNRGMVPNINANPRGRKSAKRGRKPLFNADIFKERFDTIERVFG